jgi:CubicO group peptidase (beta-lactamase class C family)
MMKFLVSALLFMLVTASFAQQPAFVADSLDVYISRYMAGFDIPGLAICIVKDGRVVLEKGYGVRDLETKAPVDAHTRFMIASNSKLFTGTAAALLDHEKTALLDTPVVAYLPAYKHFDPAVTPVVTMRDLLSHRLGTITFQGDFTFWGSNLTRSQIVERMATLKPRYGFRAQYGYCNAGYVAAAEAMKKATGKEWESLVEERLLKPIGMSETTALGFAAQSMSNMAAPHTTATGRLEQIAFDRIDNFGPAASMISSVHDLSKWLLFQLDSGRVAGQPVVPFEVLAQTRRGNTIISTTKSGMLPRHFQVYGLGVITSDHNGFQVYHHTGGAFGYVTNTCFVPEAGLGIAVLTNNDNQSFFEGLRYQILDAYLGVPYKDRSAQMLSYYRKAQLQAESDLKAINQKLKESESSDLDAGIFEGRFEHPVYGDVVINAAWPKEATIQFVHHPHLKATLVPVSDNQAVLTYNHVGYGTFIVNYEMNNDQVSAFDLMVSDFLETEPYRFVRKAKFK